MAGSLSIVFNIAAIIEKNLHLAEVLDAKTNAAIESLTIQTKAHIVQEASQKLKTTRNDFVNSLIGPEQLDGNTWAITIPAKMMWIEDGLPPGFDMKPGMLASPKAKHGKSGRYLVVPFKHNKTPTQRTPLQNQLNDMLASHLKKAGMAASTKIEKNPDGSAKLGQLGKFDIKTPTFKHNLPVGASGPLSHQLTAHARPQGQSGPSGRPYLWGGMISQNKTSKGTVQKDAMTFRTVTENSKGWIHPGLKALQSLQSGRDFAEQQWNNKFLPEILKDLGL